MEKKFFNLMIRNMETGELKEIRRKAYTFDEAEDKALDEIEYPWVFARFETLQKYERESTAMKEFTTREKLELDRMGSRGNAIIDFDENIIVLWENWKGTYEVEIYEMIDTPEETGYDRIECRLSLIEKQTTDFKDNGHALAWAMKQL